jgi:hypothetical protein
VTAKASLKASTLRFYGDNFVNHIFPVLGVTPIAQVARTDVKSLLHALAAKSLKHKTIVGIVRTLSTLLSEAVEDGRICRRTRPSAQGDSAGA